MTRRARLLAVAIGLSAAVAVSAAGSAAMAGDEGASSGRSVRVQLSGFNEDPLTISTNGNAVFRATLNKAGDTITYSLSYADTSSAVTQAHIHFGGKAQSGGVIAFLCSNLGNAPMGTPMCPAAPATVTGTITAASVVGPANQGIAAGEFAELIAAARAGKVYANIHTTMFPGGEIRGQVPGR